MKLLLFSINMVLFALYLQAEEKDKQKYLYIICFSISISVYFLYNTSSKISLEEVRTKVDQIIKESK